MGHDPRTARLRIEQTRLIDLASRSEFIEIEEISPLPGWPPEKYRVTFTCRGIASINKLTNAPVESYLHRVEIRLEREFPNQAPRMRWLTPIWHPNIQHEEPFHVCTNDTQNWYAAKHLDDLVLSLGELVQYKWYHAVWKDPWPLDKEAADWVVEYAEPNGILGPGKPFDSTPLLRPYELRLWDDRANNSGRPASKGTPHASPKFRLGSPRQTGDFKIPPSPGGNSRRQKVTLGAAVKRVVCPECGRENRLQMGDSSRREFFCGNCKTRLLA